MSGSERPDDNSIDTNDFQVIGELRDNPDHLLLLGDEGHCCRFDMPAKELMPLDPGGSWVADVILNPHTHIEVPREMVAS